MTTDSIIKKLENISVDATYTWNDLFNIDLERVKVSKLNEIINEVEIAIAQLQDVKKLAKDQIKNRLQF